MQYPIVYMVAGLSSRFGGKPKAFAKIGPNNETLIEISINRSIKAGFNKIIFIVGKETESIFKNFFKNNYKGIPIEYALQSYNPETRDKPWGTAEATQRTAGFQVQRSEPLRHYRTGQQPDEGHHH